MQYRMHKVYQFEVNFVGKTLYSVTIMLNRTRIVQCLVCFVIQCGSNFLVCESNHAV